MKFLQVIFLLCFGCIANASTLDSLHFNLSKANNQEEFKSSYIELANYYFHNQPDSCEFYAEKGYKIASALKDTANIHRFLNLQGLSNRSLGKYKLAESQLNKALEFALALDDTLRIAMMYNNVGLINIDNSNYTLALENLISALKLSEPIKDYQTTILAYINIGLIYERQENHQKSLENYQKGLQIALATENSFDAALGYNNVGFAMYMNNQPDSANWYYDKGYELATKLNYLYVKGLIASNKSEMLLSNNNFKAALQWADTSTFFFESSNDVDGVCANYIIYGDIYQKQGKYAKAEEYYQKAFQKSIEINATDRILKSANSLSSVLEKQGKFKESLAVLRKFITTKDSLFSIENSKALADLKSNFEIEKRDNTIKLFEQKEKINEMSINKQTTFRNYMIGLSVLLIIIVLIMINRYKIKQRSHIELEEKNTIIHAKNIEITDSILYAKRIQSAILPPDKVIQKHLKDSFVLYKPKDIVAGDFYWLEHKDDKVLFAAADCTGHGVPGAMVSVICNNALNRSVREHNLTEPGKILDKSREIVIQEFDKSAENVSDGMDIALCSLNGNHLQYAGAHNPLWIIRNGEILETSANKQPIGKFDNPQPYKTHSFKLEEGDSIYLFSDGFVDQFGGEKGKKFKARAFRELLLSIQDKAMLEQKKLLNAAFENWRGNLEQIDDVCIMGVRI